MKNIEIKFWVKIFLTFISTILIPVIGLFFDFDKIRLNSHHLIKLKTPSVDLYTNFLFKINIFGTLAAFIVIILLAALNKVCGWDLGNQSITVIYAVVIGLIYLVLLLTKKTVNMWDVSSKIKSDKMKEAIPYALYKSTILVAGVTWTFSLSYTTFATSFAVITNIFLEIVAIFILDSKAHFEYKYVSFFLKDGMTINKIRSEKVTQKGDWIYIKQGTEEIGFRVSSIETFYKSNSIFDSNSILIR